MLHGGVAVSRRFTLAAVVGLICFVLSIVTDIYAFTELPLFSPAVFVVLISELHAIALGKERAGGVRAISRMAALVFASLAVLVLVFPVPDETTLSFKAWYWHWLCFAMQAGVIFMWLAGGGWGALKDLAHWGRKPKKKDAEHKDTPSPPPDCGTVIFFYVIWFLVYAIKFGFMFTTLSKAG